MAREIDMNTSEEVSVIMPARNAQRYISQAIQSVRAQTYPNWRLFIIDDASFDSTPDLIAGFACHEPRIQSIRLDHQTGAAISRNTAIRVAKGRYIAFLDADDLWSPDKLARQLDFMRSRSAGFSFTGYWRGGSRGRWRYVPAMEKVDHATLLCANIIGCLTVMYDRKVFGSLEMPIIKRRQDFAFWLTLLKQSNYAYGLDEDLAGYRTGDSGSLSGGFFTKQKANWDFFRNYKDASFLSSLKNMSSHAVHKLAWSMKAKSLCDPRPWLVRNIDES